MDRFYKLFGMLVLTITVHFLGTVSCFPLFGINIDAPKDVIRKGVQKIPQIIDRIPFLHQNSKENVRDLNGNTFNQEPFTPQQNPHFINDVTTRKNQNIVYNQEPVTDKNQGLTSDKQDSRQTFSNSNQQNNQGPVIAKSRGSSNDEDSKPPISLTEDKYIWGVVDTLTNAVTDDTDYTSTTTDEWTTTDEPLNRFGTNPAVVASILG